MLFFFKLTLIKQTHIAHNGIFPGHWNHNREKRRVSQIMHYKNKCMKKINHVKQLKNKIIV